MRTWHDKAHDVIAALCRASYEASNRLPNGKLRKRHVPYAVPDTAQRLVAALGANDEETAKAILLYDYHALRAQSVP
jgi:hypothetical protein